MTFIVRSSGGNLSLVQFLLAEKDLPSGRALQAAASPSVLQLTVLLSQIWIIFFPFLFYFILFLLE